MSETEQQTFRGEDGSVQERSPRGKLGARAAAAVIIAGGVVILTDAISIAVAGGIGPQQAGFFPMIVGVGLLLFGLAFLARTTRWPDPELMAQAAHEHRGIDWWTLWLAVAAMVGYAFVLAPLGYIIATFLFILAVTWVAGSRRWVQNLLVAALFPTAVYYGFTQLLGVQLPAGLLEAIL